MVEATAIMAACLVVAILALTAVSTALVLLIWKRIPQPDHLVADDIAQRIVNAWNAGADTRLRLSTEAQDRASLELEHRRKQSQWSPHRDAAEQADGPVELATFGDSVIPPEMATMG